MSSVPGTAGAAAAILLARAGHAVTVFERVAEPAADRRRHHAAADGAGRARAARPARRGRRARGVADRSPDCACGAARRPLVDLPYARDRSRGCTGSARTAASCSRRCSRRARGAGRDDALRRGDRVARRSMAAGAGSSTTAARDTDRSTSSSPRMAACASSTRTRRGSSPDGLSVGRAVARRRRHRASRPSARIYQIVDGARTMLGFLPTGHRAGQRHVAVVSLFWSIRADRVDAWRAAGSRRGATRCCASSRAPTPILDRVTNLESVLFTRYRDVAMRAVARRSDRVHRRCRARDEPAARPGREPRADRCGRARRRDRRDAVDRPRARRYSAARLAATSTSTSSRPAS